MFAVFGILPSKSPHVGLKPRIFLLILQFGQSAPLISRKTSGIFNIEIFLQDDNQHVIHIVRHCGVCASFLHGIDHEGNHFDIRSVAQHHGERTIGA